MSAKDRNNMIETRANMAKSVLDVLLVAMENDSPPTEEAICKTISAACELLSVAEVVA